MTQPRLQEPFRCAITGLGNIAWRYDNATPSDGLGRTHASALMANCRTRLVVGADPDLQSREAFAAVTGVKTVACLDELLDHEPDLVSICSPSANHVDDLIACLKASVPMIWLEKPVSLDLKGYDDALAAWEDQGRQSAVCVNYQRRYMPCYRDGLGSLPSAETWKGISLTYSRGLEVNGSHIIDMAFHLLGDPGDMDLHWVSNDADNPSFQARAGKLEISGQGLDLDYHCIDFAVTHDMGRFSILHGGMTVLDERRVEHVAFPGFYRLDGPRSVLDEEAGLHGMNKAMSSALDDLLDASQAQRQPVSSLVTAGQSQRFVNAIRLKQAAGLT